jgi:phosphoribosyl-ATP pyrophosphohydrolase
VSDLLLELENIVRRRGAERPEGSYAVALLDDPELRLRKVMEEAFEVCLELHRDPVDSARIAEEAADLLFHLVVGLVGAGVSVADVASVLEARRR